MVIRYVIIFLLSKTKTLILVFWKRPLQILGIEENVHRSLLTKAL